ncbi:MAG: 16S rRNA (cytosine(1402)-N(4))-methyltransferase RsmH [Gemmatimonadetes bacterium]|nr:16S rRNA (cytosine(1402)-N(4))-methyltransferase RsmH [Gemmatimonadota bacterium]
MGRRAERGWSQRPSGGNAAFHTPVMVAEVMELLRPERGGLYVDGTVGAGGHAAALLARCEIARVAGLDRDPEALEAARVRLGGFGGRVRLRQADYANAVEALGLEAGSVAGVLLDLGLSSRQVDDAARGFTFRRGAPLDMRMTGSGEGSAERTAADLLNEASAEELARVFREYGEERRSRALAAEVVRRRRTARFATSDDLVAALSATYGRGPTVREKARIFQALRIAVNRELESLAAALPRLRDVLEPGGVMVVIAYHSLEDRMVKEAFREWSKACVCPPEFPVCRCRGRPLGELLTRGALRPAATELASNPRSRSARLRAWRRAA